MNTLKKITNYITEKGREAKNYGCALIVSAPFILNGCSITNDATQSPPPMPDFNDPEYHLDMNYKVRLVTPKGNVVELKENAKFAEEQNGFKNVLTFTINDTVVNGENLGRKKTFIDYDYVRPVRDRNGVLVKYVFDKKFELDSIAVSQKNTKPTSKGYSLAYLRDKFPDIAAEQQEQYNEGREFIRQLVEEQIRKDLGERVNDIYRPSMSGSTIHF